MHRTSFPYKYAAVTNVLWHHNRHLARHGDSYHPTPGTLTCGGVVEGRLIIDQDSRRAWRPWRGSNWYAWHWGKHTSRGCCSACYCWVRWSDTHTKWSYVDYWQVVHDRCC